MIGINACASASGSMCGAVAMADDMERLAQSSGACLEDVGRTTGQVMRRVADLRGLDMAADLSRILSATREILASVDGVPK